MMCRSVRHTPAPPIFTTTSSGPWTVGSGTSSTTGCWWYPCSLTALTSPPRLRRGARGDQRPAHQVGTRQHGLAQKVGPQLVQLADRLALEGAREPGPGGHPAVDRVGGEVVLQRDVGRPYTVQCGHRVVGVGDHEEGEVGRAEVGRQPQPYPGVPVGGDGARRDEAERGDRLVQLRVAHRRQRAEYPRAVDEGGAHTCSTNRASSCAAGVPSPASSRYPAGTSMPYSLAALRPRIFFLVAVLTRG